MKSDGNSNKETAIAVANGQTSPFYEKKNGLENGIPVCQSRDSISTLVLCSNLNSSPVSISLPPTHFVRNSEFKSINSDSRQTIQTLTATATFHRRAGTLHEDQEKPQDLGIPFRICFPWQCLHMYSTPSKAIHYPGQTVTATATATARANLPMDSST